MANRTQLRSRISLAGISLAAAAIGYSPSAHACVYGSPEVSYAPGRYANGHLGDVVAIHSSATSMLTPIMAELGESFTHVLMVEDNTGTLMSEQISNPGMIQSGWTQNHPFCPYDMAPVMPTGVLDTVFADGVGNYYQYFYGARYISPNSPKATSVSDGMYMVAEWATGVWGGIPSQPVGATINYFDEITGVQASGGVVLGTEAAPAHAGGCPSTTGNTWVIGNEATGTEGYSWYGLMHPVVNGTCVQFLSNTCAVPMPTPSPYTGAMVTAALTALYNEIYDACWNEVEGLGGIAGFIIGLTGSKSSICNNAAEEFVNTILENDPWDTSHENWNIAVDNIVSPARLEAGYPGPKAPVTTVAGAYVDNGYCCENLDFGFGDVQLEYTAAGAFVGAPCVHE